MSLARLIEFGNRLTQFNVGTGERGASRCQCGGRHGIADRKIWIRTGSRTTIPAPESMWLHVMHQSAAHL